MSQTSSIDAAVAVIGGGPIGLTTFVGLRRAGVDAVLVEKHPSTAIVPKALLLNERTMEIFRQIGLEDDVKRVALPRDVAGWICNSDTLTSPAFERTPMVYRSDKTWVESQLCSQDALEPALLAHAERVAPGRVLFGTRLEALRQDADGVEAGVVDVTDGTRRTIRARYAVGADGSRSTVRDLLGIAMEGRTLGHSVHVIFRAPIAPLVADRPAGMYYVGDNLVFIMVDGDRRWRLMFDAVDPGESFTEERVRAVIREGAGVSDLDVEFEGIYPWVPAAMLAERFRDGRVFLVGDAAHVRPPWGGLGLNAGIVDSHNIVWKLAAALAGRAGDGLLDTYEAERRPIAQRTIDTAIRNAGQVAQIRNPDPAVREANSRRRRAEGLILGYTYTSAAVIPDGTPAPHVDDPVVDYAPTARPGHRAPHFWVDEGASRASVGDRFGEGFVLLAGPGGAAWREAARTLATEIAMPLAGYVVGGEHADLGDPDDRWSALYCAASDGAVLVRPDGHVAWRSATLPPDPRAALLDALTVVLDLRHAPSPTAV